MFSFGSQFSMGKGTMHWTLVKNMELNTNPGQ